MYVIAHVDISMRLHVFPKAYRTLTEAKQAAISRLERAYDLQRVHWHHSEDRWIMYLPDAYVTITKVTLDR